VDRVSHVVGRLNCLSCALPPAEVTDASQQQPPLLVAEGEVRQMTFPEFVQEGLRILEEMQKIGESGSLLAHTVSTLLSRSQGTVTYLDYANVVCIFLSLQRRRLLKGVFDPLYASVQNVADNTSGPAVEADRFQGTLDSLKTAKDMAARLVLQGRGKELWEENMEGYLYRTLVLGGLQEVVVRIGQCGFLSEHHSLVQSLCEEIRRFQDLKFSVIFFELCSSILGELLQKSGEISVEEGPERIFVQLIVQVQSGLGELQEHVNKNFRGEICVENDEEQRESLNQIMCCLENIMGGLEAVYERICQMWLLSKHDIYLSLQGALSQLIGQVAEESVRGVLEGVLQVAGRSTISTFVKEVVCVARAQTKEETWKIMWKEIEEGARFSFGEICPTGRGLEEIKGAFKRGYLRSRWSLTLKEMDRSCKEPFLRQIGDRIRISINFRGAGRENCTEKEIAEEVAEEVAQCVEKMQEQFHFDDESAKHCEPAERVQKFAKCWSSQCNDRLENGGARDFKGWTLPTSKRFSFHANDLLQSLKKLSESDEDARRHWVQSLLNSPSLYSVEQPNGRVGRIVRQFYSLWEVNPNLKQFCDLSCEEVLRIARLRNNKWILNSKSCYVNFHKCVVDVLSRSSDLSVQELALDAQNKLDKVSCAYIDCAAQCQRYIFFLQEFVKSYPSCKAYAQELVSNLDELICALGDLQYHDKITQSCQERGQLCRHLYKNASGVEQEGIQKQELLLNHVIDERFIRLPGESPQEKALESIWKLVRELMSLKQHALSKKIRELLTARSIRRSSKGEWQNDFIQIAMCLHRGITLEGVMMNRSN